MQSISPDAALFLPNASATEKFGSVIARLSILPKLLFLHGELGAGKTTLVRGVLRAFGYSHAVSSPTFSIVEHYPLERVNVFHFDFYRFSTAYDLENIGFRDYWMLPNTLFLIEWPERAVSGLPTPDLSLSLQWSIGKIDNGRNLQLLHGVQYWKEIRDHYRSLE